MEEYVRLVKGYRVLDSVRLLLDLNSYDLKDKLIKSSVPKHATTLHVNFKKTPLQLYNNYDRISMKM